MKHIFFDVSFTPVQSVIIFIWVVLSLGTNCVIGEIEKHKKPPFDKHKMNMFERVFWATFFFLYYIYMACNLFAIIIFSSKK